MADAQQKPSDDTKPDDSKPDGSNQSSTSQDDQGSHKPDNNSQSQDGQEGDKDDLEKWKPENVKDYVKELRRENKSYRQQAKNLEDQLNDLRGKLKGVVGGDDSDDETPPEQKIDSLKSEIEKRDLRLHILETANEHGLAGKKAVKYFEFLVSERLGQLQEGQELSDEDLESIVSEVRESTGGPKPTSTTVTGQSSQQGDNPEPGSQEVGLDEFMAMGPMQKSELYRKNQQLYDKLLKEAKEKKLFR